jgi:hypothetical protein
LLRPAWPSLPGAVTTWLKSARPLLAVLTKFSRLSMPPADANWLQARITAVVMSFFMLGWVRIGAGSS